MAFAGFSQGYSLPPVFVLHISHRSNTQRAGTQTTHPQQICLDLRKGPLVPSLVVNRPNLLLFLASQQHNLLGLSQHNRLELSTNSRLIPKQLSANQLVYSLLSLISK